MSSVLSMELVSLKSEKAATLICSSFVVSGIIEVVQADSTCLPYNRCEFRRKPAQRKDGGNIRYWKMSFNNAPSRTPACLMRSRTIGPYRSS